jgi:hypothetical protein
LRAFGRHVEATLDSLGDSSLPAQAQAHARTILTESRTFIQETLARGEISLDGYRAYSGRILEAVLALRYFATETQVRAVVAQLEAWRDDMGAERWRELSAVVIAPYTIGSETPNLQCLRFVMDPERVEDHLIVVGGDYGKDVDTAVSVLSRLYTDRFVARMVFTGNSAEDRANIRSLSSQRDFMADTTGAALQKLAAERRRNLR